VSIDSDSLDSPDCRTFRLTLEYDGRDFEGWQIQSGERPARTIQGVLGEAFRAVTREPARIRGAGRTDAGVHAMGQVASVQVVTGLSVEALTRSLNGWFPRDLAVREIVEVPHGWDALREARGKHYRYQIWNGRQRSPLRMGRFHWLRDPLAVDRMREAALAFVGTHDFAALQGAGSSVKTTVRTIQALRIEGRAGAEVILDVEGGGFLRHMVRNLAGTLIEIGRGRWEVRRAAEILASLDRQEAGPTAPAEGLVLVRVRDSWSEAGAKAAISSSGGVSVDESGPVG
jgi:tRNA pseudouridine38-40 synthase